MSKIKPICKNCAHFNWKLSVTKNWGECLNPKVEMRVSFRLTDLGVIGEIQSTKQYRALQAEVEKYTRVQFCEDTFGCIHFEV